ncbi:hypothetical protein BD779DRAFT_1481260 [Infundibulicybe gibba]|nr:hypothetical protein BD779DRAFT_1481260 [Infundibulicybe gibba]
MPTTHSNTSGSLPPPSTTCSSLVRNPAPASQPPRCKHLQSTANQPEEKQAQGNKDEPARRPRARPIKSANPPPKRHRKTAASCIAADAEADAAGAPRAPTRTERELEVSGATVTPLARSQVVSLPPPPAMRGVLAGTEAIPGSVGNLDSQVLTGLEGIAGPMIHAHADPLAHPFVHTTRAETTVRVRPFSLAKSLRTSIDMANAVARVEGARKLGPSHSSKQERDGTYLIESPPTCSRLQEDTAVVEMNRVDQLRVGMKSRVMVTLAYWRDEKRRHQQCAGRRDGGMGRSIVMAIVVAGDDVAAEEGTRIESRDQEVDAHANRGVAPVSMVMNKVIWVRSYNDMSDVVWYWRKGATMDGWGGVGIDKDGVTVMLTYWWDGAW